MADLAPLEVEVWGDFACFTRPEMKVERVTYPVMTPSAARGVLEAIFWKPEFRWRIEAIEVLSEIGYINFMRNEVKSRASERVAREALRNGVPPLDSAEDRTQRHTLALRDVRYRIRAQADPASGLESDAAKYRDQFRRRVQRGQCQFMPYLGCREFVAWFAPPDPGNRPIGMTGPIGRMLLDMRYHGAMGAATPLFFDAELERGVLRVPRLPEGG